MFHLLMGMEFQVLPIPLKRDGCLNCDELHRRLIASEKREVALYGDLLEARRRIAELEAAAKPPP